MDPKIWGGKLWNFIYDICWLLETKGPRLPQKTKTSSNIFFQSLRYLLPCVYCRESYEDYFTKLSGAPPNGKGALRWAYDLKNMVNKKLKTKDSPPTYECFERRMKTWSSASNANDLWDILGVFILNCIRNSKDISTCEKKSAFQLMLWTLPDLLFHLPNRRAQALVLEKKKPSKEDLHSQHSLIGYLCGRANALDNGRRSSRDIFRKYGNCKVFLKKKSK